MYLQNDLPKSVQYVNSILHFSSAIGIIYTETFVYKNIIEDMNAYNSYLGHSLTTFTIVMVKTAIVPH